MDSKNQVKSPQLGFISQTSEHTGLERRKLPRLSVTSEQFKLSENGKIFSIHDLSLEGLALWIVDSRDLESFAVGLLLTGTLNLKREKYEVQIRVRNRGRDRIGCEFENLSSSATVALEQFLSPAALGAELKPIPASEEGVLWYHAFSGTDLLFRNRSEGYYRRFTLYLLGFFIQWDHAQGLSTGRVMAANEKSEVRGIVRLETLLLDADKTLDPHKLNVAKTVILSSNLPDDLKKWCLLQIKL